MALRTSDGGRVGTKLLAGTLVGLLALLVACTNTGGTSDRETSPSPARNVPPGGAATPSQASGQPDLSRSQPSRRQGVSATVKLSFGGDVMFEGDLRELLDQPSTGLAPIRAVTTAADFTMVNLESALTTRGTPGSKKLEEREPSLSLPDQPGSAHGAASGRRRRRFRRQQSRRRFRRRGAVRHAARQAGQSAARHRRGPESRRGLRSASGDPQGSTFVFFAADASFLESTEPYWQAGATTPGLAAARGAGPRHPVGCRPAGSGRRCRSRRLPPLGYGEFGSGQCRAEGAGSGPLPRRGRGRGRQPHPPAAGRGMARSDVCGVRLEQLHLVPRFEG